MDVFMVLSAVAFFGASWLLISLCEQLNQGDRS